jgi:hypothetical protein
MEKRQKFTLGVALAVTLVGALASPRRAQAMLPDCTPGVYDYCVPFCGSDPVSQCQSQLGCRGGILGGYCSFNWNACGDGQEDLTCYVGSA